MDHPGDIWVDAGRGTEGEGEGYCGGVLSMVDTEYICGCLGGTSNLDLGSHNANRAFHKDNVQIEQAYLRPEVFFFFFYGGLTSELLVLTFSQFFKGHWNALASHLNYGSG